MYTTGDIIKQIRKKHNLTQDELGEILGVKKSAIQKYENGGINNLKFDTIRKICTHFNIPPWFLIFPEEVILNDFKQTDFDGIKKAAALNRHGRIQLNRYINTLLCDLIKIEEYTKEEP